MTRTTIAAQDLGEFLELNAMLDDEALWAESFSNTDPNKPNFGRRVV